VISLKIMGFVSQAGESRGKLIAHGFIFAAGVLVSFWILTGILLAFRSAGDLLGWGFQLQEPGFVIALILLMVVMALSLFGVFEIGTGMSGVGGKLTMSTGYGGSFWSGALATLLATPCTAPFMGAALGFALEQPPAITFLIFTVLALGMAFPYLLLSVFPGWLKKLPKPGPWMETFKQVMGFPMLAVAAWLLWVLGAQIGNDGLGILFVALILVAFGAWLMGRFAVPSRSARSRIIARITAGVLAAAAIGISYQAAGSRQSESTANDADPATIIQGHREAGRNVFVDFTAKWCLVCQANKPAMYSDTVKAAFKEENVEFVVIDNTNRDPRIEEYINRFGRTGVPFYPLFPADISKPPVILPQNLTPGIILEHLEKL
jgi:thiol:disulfide interchange protein DsbD